MLLLRPSLCERDETWNQPASQPVIVTFLASYRHYYMSLERAKVFGEGSFLDVLFRYPYPLHYYSKIASATNRCFKKLTKTERYD